MKLMLNGFFLVEKDTNYTWLVITATTRTLDNDNNCDDGEVNQEQV